MIHGIIRLLVHSLLLLQANHATRLLKRICLMFHSKIELPILFNDFYRLFLSWLDGVDETIIQAIITTQITVASGGSQLAQKIDQKLKNVSFLHLEKDVSRILFSLKNKTFGQQFSTLFNPVR